MLRTYILFGLAAAGFGFAVYMSQKTNATVPVSAPVAPPAATPFEKTIAGAGIVEARSENIAIGSPVAGVVMKVDAIVGKRVNANDPLFELDNRSLNAELGVKRAALVAANAKLDRLEKMPRKEEIPAAKARVAAAKAMLSDVEFQLSTAEKVTIPGAVSAEELSRRRHAVDEARARLEESSASLDLLLAGAWTPDLAVARADVASAQSDLDRTSTELDRLIVRAPIAGEILKVNVRPGEFAPSQALAAPLIIFGDTSRLHVRIDIDEADIWRYRTDAKAIAMLRGNSQLKTDLRFERIEPYVVPKRSLTGDSTERVDTRVLQVLYSFERDKMPVHVGEQVDVFFDAGGAPSPQSQKSNDAPFGAAPGGAR